MSYSARNFSGPGAGPILRKSSGSSFLQTDIWLSFWFKYCLKTVKPLCSLVADRCKVGLDYESKCLPQEHGNLSV